MEKNALPVFEALLIDSWWRQPPLAWPGLLPHGSIIPGKHLPELFLRAS